MVTGRMTPIIPIAVRSLSGRGFSGRRNAQRALDGNSFMCGANPHLSTRNMILVKHDAKFAVWCNWLAQADRVSKVRV